MTQRFKATLDFSIYRYTEADIRAAIREGIQRMAVRAYRERYGAQSYPPGSYLSDHDRQIDVTLDPVREAVDGSASTQESPVGTIRKEQ